MEKPPIRKVTQSKETNRNKNVKRKINKKPKKKSNRQK